MIDNWEKLRVLCDVESKDRVYMFQAIKRKKDNPDMDRSEKVLKTVVTHEVFNEKLHSRLKEYVAENARVYFRVGAIDAMTAALRTIAKMSEMIASGQYNVREAYDSVCGSMKTNFWVIDIDDRNIDLKPIVAEFVQLQLNAKQVPLDTVIDTPNGYHMITRPFNPAQLSLGILKHQFEIKKNQPTILYANERVI